MNSFESGFLPGRRPAHYSILMAGIRRIFILQLRANPLLRLARNAALLSALFLFHGETASALIFYSTSDPAYNTTAPTGNVAGSGWQWQGNWGGFLGTPIGPHHFITARHVGGAVGSTFVLGGTTYTATRIHEDASSDLRIVEVSGTFPSWAPLHRGTNEVSKPLVVFGRGLSRGAEVRVNGALKGWQWGADPTLRWGQNTVSTAQDRGGTTGWLLGIRFDAAGVANEAQLASGDSSGGVFLQESNVWALAGINFAVDGNFNYTNSGTGFGAAIFNAGGLYYGSSPNWQYIAPKPYDITTSFYATRIATRITWIDSILSAPTSADATDVPLVPGVGKALLAMCLFSAGALRLKILVPV